MLSWLFGRKQTGRADKDLPSYEEARDIAEKGDARKRRWLAQRRGLAPEFLYYFATDPEPAVRRAVAENDDTPLQADVILAEDDDDEVRAELARKIGRIMPELSDVENEKITEMVMEVVRVLAQDKTVRVRALIAAEIKSLDTVPKAIVDRLARDVESVVSAPVLEYSPLLTDKELVEIIASGIDGGALRAIARRRNIGEVVSASVVAEEDGEATRELAHNKTAHIADETMVEIGAQSEKDEKLLAALIERDDLTVRTIRRIASFVGAAILDRLQERYRNLDPTILEEIRQQTRKHVMKGAVDENVDPAEDARARAKRLHKKGKLDDDAIIEAMDGGDRAFVVEALALMAGLPPGKVKTIMGSDSGKAITAVTWKAGLGMDRAESLQLKIAKIPPRQVVRGKPAGTFPLSEDEMTWYLDFFD